MNQSIKKQIIALIHREVIPAIGCTEPIAVASASAKAAEVLGGKPERVEVYLSANILKNAMGVGIPGTGMVGLPIAIALGSLIGRSAYGLEVLKDLSPEGLAAGVSLGSGDLKTAMLISGGIALQNIPEGLVTVTPMLAAGFNPKKTFLCRLTTGINEIVGTFVGYFAVTLASAVLPFCLAFAGGTMLFVISDEMIPETHDHGNERAATYSLLVGFCLMLITDVLLV